MLLLLLLLDALVCMLLMDGHRLVRGLGIVLLVRLMIVPLLLLRLLLPFMLEALVLLMRRINRSSPLLVRRLLIRHGAGSC